jgi:hypothetical protein
MRNLLKLSLTLGFLLSLSISIEARADAVEARCDIYPKGTDQASASIACTFSQRQGFIHITRSDGKEHDLSPHGDQPGNYLDQSGEPAFKKSGLGKEGLIFQLADESVYVYWDISTLAANEAPTGFDQSYQLQGITFRVSSANNSSLNRLTIQPGGLESGNEPISVEIDGSVTSAEIADLDANGSPEIYAYVNSAGSGSYGSLVAYAVNNGKSLTPIYMSPISDDAKNSIGYMGHDEFSVVESTLVRRFPIYLDGDVNAAPSGGTRQLQYKLVAGEAGWILRLDRVVEY